MPEFSHRFSLKRTYPFSCYSVNLCNLIPLGRPLNSKSISQPNNARFTWFQSIDHRLKQTEQKVARDHLDHINIAVIKQVRIPTLLVVNKPLQAVDISGGILQLVYLNHGHVHFGRNYFHGCLALSPMIERGFST